MTPTDKSARVRAYFQALTEGNTAQVLSLFTPEATVLSPFLGEIAASAFFPKLEAASNGSKLTVFDVLLNEDASSAAGHFRYDWTLASGDDLSFVGVDLFHFAPDGRFTKLLIYYDTHPLREEVGDKYSNP